MVETLVQYGVLDQQGDRSFRWGSNAAWVPTVLYDQWQEGIATCLPHYLDTLVENLPRIETWLLSDFPGEAQGQRWSALAGFILDLGVTKALIEAGWQRSQPERFWLWLIQSPDPELIAFGVRSQLDPQTGTIFSELWVGRIRKVPPLPLNLSPEDIRALHALWRAPTTSPSVSDFARAHYFGLVRRSSTQNHLVTPFLSPRALERFDSLFAETARQIVRRALLSKPGIPTIPAEFETKRDVYRHAFARLLMQSALREVVRLGILSLPDPVAQAAWGTWLATGPEAQRHFSPPRGVTTC